MTCSIVDRRKYHGEFDTSVHKLPAPLHMILTEQYQETIADGVTTIYVTRILKVSCNGYRVKAKQSTSDKYLCIERRK